jgi:hypothetical protein
MSDMMVLACVSVVAVVAIALLAVFMLRAFSRETMRMVAQADERVLGSWSLVERAMSRITAIHFPNGHALFRNSSGGLTDGAQLRPKKHYVEELDENMAHVAQVNGVLPVTVPQEPSEG